MVKTKTLHIWSHILISLLLITLAIFLLTFHFITNLYSGGGVGFFEYTLANPITIGMGFFILILSIWSVYFALSYYKTEIDNNKQYKISGWTNIMVFVFSLIYLISLPILLILTDGINNWRVLNYVNSALLGFIPLLLIISLVISFIIFLIGYYKNKK